MKKILAIVMAIVMMMAVAVPAFAAETATNITKTDPTPDATGKQTGTAVVKTVYNENTDWSYTITIPADMEIAWNDDGVKNMTYYVESQLLIGASIKVSVVGNDKLTASSGDELAYTLTGGGEVEFGAVNAKNTTAPNVTNGTNVQVKIPSFAGVPVGTYSDTLTYTVEYIAPTTV